MSFGEASALLAQLDANHSSPLLIWHAERRSRLRLALEDELGPIVESLRCNLRCNLRCDLEEDELSPIVESLGVGDGRAGAPSTAPNTTPNTAPGTAPSTASSMELNPAPVRSDVVWAPCWAPTALLAKLAAAETDLNVGGLFLEPFVAADGKFSFATAAAAGHFLAALITALRDLSRPLHSAVMSASQPRFAIEAEEEEAASAATGARGAQDDARYAQDDALGAQDDALGEALDAETAVGRVGRHAALMWKALLQLLTLHASLCTHRACVASADFFFGSVRSPMPLSVLSLVLQVLQALSKPGGAVVGAIEFASSVKGAHLLGLVALSTRTPTLAAGSLGLVVDLVRRSPAAVLAFLRLGGLVLLLRPLLEPVAPAAVTPVAPAAVTPAAVTPVAPAAVTPVAPAAVTETRLLIVRVLSALTSDSRHGAEIAECVCELFTMRFRMLLEGAGAHPEAFLAFLEADHTAGPSYSTIAREWDAKRRTQLHALLEQVR